MKYFTPELIARLNSPDNSVADAATEEWEKRLEQYERDLQEVEPQLPEHIREFNGLLLHDARVYSLARHGDRLVMILRKDIPPRDLVIIDYVLSEEPSINREALSPLYRDPAMEFLYDEFTVVRQGDVPLYEQSILFSNAWEVRLRFVDVRVTLADPIYSLAGTTPGLSVPAIHTQPT